MERGNHWRLSGDGRQPHCHPFVLNRPCAGRSRGVSDEAAFIVSGGQMVNKKFRQREKVFCAGAAETLFEYYVD